MKRCARFTKDTTKVVLFLWFGARTAYIITPIRGVGATVCLKVEFHGEQRKSTSVHGEKGEKMYKAFLFLLAVLSLTLIGSLAVMGVFCAVDLVKDLIDDWREHNAKID